MAAIMTLEGHRGSGLGRGGARQMSLGECKRVRTGRGGRCSIELCRTGKGQTGYQFKKGTRRCR